MGLATQTDELVKAENLSRWFEVDGREIKALDNVTFALHRGDMAAIVGASGAGKSTLLQLLGAVDTPSDGTVYYKGENIYKMSERKLARFRAHNVGFVFQSGALLPEFSAEENVALAGMIAGASRRSALKSARLILKSVGLGKRLTHRPGKLSGGESQRVAVARALINEPDLVLADEPTGNLDTKTGEEILELLFRLNRENGQTFAIVTHNISLVREMGRVIRICDGKFVDSGNDMLKWV